MKKYFMVIGALLLALLAGCNTTSKPTEELPKVQQESIEVWTSFGIHVPGQHYTKIWGELEEKYSCDIEVKSYSTEQMKSKLRAALVCNELPDAFFVWGGTYPEQLFETGTCLPLQEVLAASDVSFREEYVMPYQDGNCYIIPCLPEDYGVTYYNRYLLDLMGLKQPNTWEELLQLVEDVKRYNEEHNTRYTAINLGNKDGEGGELLYCTLVDRLEPNAYEELKAGTRSFDDQVFLRAAKMVCELEEAQAFSYDFMEVGEMEAIENFVNNEAVIFPTRSSILYYLIDKMGEDALGVMPFPSCNEAYHDTYGSYLMEMNHTLTPGLCINATSLQTDLTTQICLDFAQRVNACNVSEYGYINMTTATLSVRDELPASVEELQELLHQAEEFSPCWYAELPMEMADGWRNTTKKLYAGELDVEEFIQMGGEYMKIN